MALIFTKLLMWLSYSEKSLENYNPCSILQLSLVDHSLKLPKFTDEPCFEQIMALLLVI